MSPETRHLLIRNVIFVMTDDTISTISEWLVPSANDSENQDFLEAFDQYLANDRRIPNHDPEQISTRLLNTLQLVRHLNSDHRDLLTQAFFDYCGRNFQRLAKTIFSMNKSQLTQANSCLKLLRNLPLENTNIKDSNQSLFLLGVIQFNLAAYKPSMQKQHSTNF